MKNTLTTTLGAALLLAWLAYFFAASAIRAALGLAPTESEESQ